MLAGARKKHSFMGLQENQQLPICSKWYVYVQTTYSENLLGIPQWLLLCQLVINFGDHCVEPGQEG